MYVARILYPVEVLGPGKRIGIWFCGCPRRCKGCSNPELWEFKKVYETTPEMIYDFVKMISDNNIVDGFTITGGDPMYQSKDLQKLLRFLVEISDDILVYTGYVIEQLTEKQLDNIAVLIDGEYIEKGNDNSFLRGSNNQRIHILSKKWKERYVNYCSISYNQIQNFMTSNGVISVGIHKPNFSIELDKNILLRGLKEDNE